MKKRVSLRSTAIIAALFASGCGVNTTFDRNLSSQQQLLGAPGDVSNPPAGTTTSGTTTGTVSGTTTNPPGGTTSGTTTGTVSGTTTNPPGGTTSGTTTGTVSGTTTNPPGGTTSGTTTGTVSGTTTNPPDGTTSGTTSVTPTATVSGTLPNPLPSGSDSCISVEDKKVTICHTGHDPGENPKKHNTISIDVNAGCGHGLYFCGYPCGLNGEPVKVTSDYVGACK